MVAVRAAIPPRAPVAAVHSLTATCSQLSRAAGEPLAASAPATRAWLAIEQPGAWGRDALLESRFPRDVAAELAARCDAAGIKPLLIRRFGRADTGGPRKCILVDPGRGLANERVVSNPAELLSVPLDDRFGDRLRARQFLVCTNGKRDRCCAQLGRRVAEALSRARPQQAWECSHLGGHRFAANVLVLPDGLLFGRLDADAACTTVEALEAGELPLDHLRGRCGLPPLAQAAEIEARRVLELHRLDALEPGGIAGDEVTLHAAGGRPVRVRLEATQLADVPASCRGDTRETPTAWRLVTLTEV